MGVLSWIIFGLIAGALAKWIRPGNDPQGCFVTIIIGIIGAFLGGWIGTLIGWGDITGFNFRSFLLAVVGGVIALWIYAMITKKK